MQHLSTKADYHCSPKAEWRSCSTTLKDLWIPSRVIISYKLLSSCTFCHTKQINMRLAYILSFYICQLSMAIKRSRRRENKEIAKDKIDHTSTRPWTPSTTPGKEKQVLQFWTMAVLGSCFQRLLLLPSVKTRMMQRWIKDWRDWAKWDMRAFHQLPLHIDIDNVRNEHLFVGICPAAASKQHFQTNHINNSILNCLF